MTDDGDRAAAEVRMPRETLQRAVHDLKNPLAVVRATLEWLEVELAGMPDALDAVGDASNATARLLGVVEDLHLLSTFEAGAVAGARVVVSDCAEVALAPSAARIAARGVRVALAPGADRNASVDGDAGLVARAIEMLVDAASHGAPSGLVIVVDVRSRGGRVEVTVGGGDADTGPARKATGLSLYVASRVVEAHGGVLRIDPGSVTASLPAV